MTPSKTAAALRELADAIERETDPHELLRLCALASWRMQEITKAQKEPEPVEPK